MLSRNAFLQYVGLDMISKRKGEAQHTHNVSNIRVKPKHFVSEISEYGISFITGSATRFQNRLSVLLSIRVMRFIPGARMSVLGV
jgi:hypothetical protein